MHLLLAHILEACTTGLLEPVQDSLALTSLFCTLESSDLATVPADVAAGNEGTDENGEVRRPQLHSLPQVRLQRLVQLLRSVHRRGRELCGMISSRHRDTCGRTHVCSIRAEE